LLVYWKLDKQNTKQKEGPMDLINSKNPSTTPPWYLGWAVLFAIAACMLIGASDSYYNETRPLIAPSLSFAILVISVPAAFVAQFYINDLFQTMRVYPVTWFDSYRAVLTVVWIFASYLGDRSITLPMIGKIQGPEPAPSIFILALVATIGIVAEVAMASIRFLDGD
jgi:hypothetical protein